MFGLRLQLRGPNIHTTNEYKNNNRENAKNTRLVTETDWSIWKRAAEANPEPTKLRFIGDSSIQPNKSQDGMGLLTITAENMTDTEIDRNIEDA